MSIFNKGIEDILSDFTKLDNSDVKDIEYYVFPQNWGSTSLGYSGIGGQAMTSSHTIVFYNTYTGNAMLSYGGRFIKLANPNRKFFEDVAKQRIEPEWNLGKYRRNIDD